MATCKDCFHYDACKGILDAVGIEMDAECQNQETLCGNFMSCNITKNIMTNADRIRAMSDEELARHLHCIGWDCHLCAEHERLDNEPFMRDQKCDENCSDHCLEWLKQPTE